LQILQNVGNPQNAIDQPQRNLNIGAQPPSPQNTANLSINTFIAIQQFNNLIKVTDPFTRMQDIEN
ncbi:14821_t:CDS:1, partial [Gigaspora margarita]